MDAVVAVWFPAKDGWKPSYQEMRNAPWPGETAWRELESWGRARGITIKVNRDDGPVVPYLHLDPSIADAVEKELSSARDALTRLDVDATEHALVRAGALLRAHPELPQAAWLLAEVERGWSARWMRVSPPDPERAARAWQRAAELDGGRVAGIGETDQPKSLAVDVIFSADRPRDLTVLVDGSEISLGTKKVASGEHAVVAKNGNYVFWADWVSFSDHELVRIPSFEPNPCDGQDLEAATLENGFVNATGVSCGRWIAASPVTANSLRVALCEKDHCGPWVVWESHATSLAPVLPPHKREHKKASPWVAVAAVALAAVLITGVTLVAAGVFDAPPHETQFVGGGVKSSSVPNIPLVSP